MSIVKRSRKLATFAAAAAAAGGTAGLVLGGAGVAQAATTAHAATSYQGCATGDLSAQVTTGSGAAGNIIKEVVFTNTGSTSCTLYGYPGVSYVTGASGHQVGAAAVRTTAGVTERPVLLPAGAEAVAKLQEADRAGGFDPSTCNLTSYAGFRIYPPGQRGALFVSQPGQACANTGDKTLHVEPVTPGSGARYLTSSPSPAPSYRVVNEQTAVPSGYNIDVAGQVAAAGTKITEWRANSNDPAQDFAVLSPPGVDFPQLVYVPFGSLANAKAQPAGYARTQAVAAYNSDGTAKYCVTASSHKGAGAVLEPCATTINGGQDFVFANGVDPGHHIIETTYPLAVIGSNAPEFALNDAGFGKNGSSVISWPANHQQNEEFYSAG